MNDTILEVQNLSMEFGGLRALSDFNLTLSIGDLVGLIGPNGSGKTTVFNLLTGIYRPVSGTITLHKERMNGLKMHQFTEKGIARTFQNIRLFKEMSVLENVMVAVRTNHKSGFFDILLHTSAYQKEEIEIREKAYDLLKIFGLDDKKDYMADQLPYGDQRKLEIARAIATNPSVLLLDEPAAGMNPTETGELLQCIEMIRKRYQIAVLLIEHDMSLVMNLCQNIIVLDCGETIAIGAPREISVNEKVIEAYLGSPRKEGEAYAQTK